MSEGDQRLEREAEYDARSQTSLLKGSTKKNMGPASKLLSKKSGQSAAAGKTAVVYQLPGNWKVPQNNKMCFLS